VSKTRSNSFIQNINKNVISFIIWKVRNKIYIKLWGFKMSRHLAALNMPFQLQFPQSKWITVIMFQSLEIVPTIKGKAIHVETLRVPVGWGSQILRQSANFTPRRYSWYSCLLQTVPTLGLLWGWKDYVNEKSGIEPVTFRFLAQCLNQTHHCIPPSTH
jgi:hypothetical protein